MQPVISEIVLPNGLSYRFSYLDVNGAPNPGGELTRINLPTGGYIRYEYQTLVRGENSLGVGPVDSRVVSKRVYSPDGVMENTWLYSYSPNYDVSAVSQKPTTVTHPTRNQP